MSDNEEEYEYEYDDDDEEMQDDGDGFVYSDEESNADDTEVALENAYYNAKGLRETSETEASQAFEQVVEQEKQISGHLGAWSFKSLKQLVKLHLRDERVLPYYRRLLECCATGKNSPNAIEKGIQGMLERVAADSERRPAAAVEIYDETLQVFHPSKGACPNERLWFKANLKYGQLLYEMNEPNKLQAVLKQLQQHQATSTSSSTQTVEVYALQIQVYYLLKDHKRLRETFRQAMAVRGGIPHPRTLARMQELGGKTLLAGKEYEAAGKTFFQAFKSYDEAGDGRRLQCLKYLVISSMLHASTINPFDSQEARPYRDDPEIVALTNLVQAFHNNEIQTFERILRQGKIGMDDDFVREHMEDLLRTMRTQVLRRVVRPYRRISLQALAGKLNNIPVESVEELLVSLITDGSLDGLIDQVEGVLVKQAERSESGANNASHSKISVQGRCELMQKTIAQLQGITKRALDLPDKENQHSSHRGMGMALG